VIKIRNKKGALELSVNAIVILILAIVMLGLGLGFIRGMFGQVSTTFEEQISAEPEPAIPYAATPITLSREKIIATSGEQAVLKFTVYNALSADKTAVTPAITCTGIVVAATAVSINPKDIKSGEFATYNALITVPATTPKTGLCQIKVTDPPLTKDFTLEVR
jgi:hypothetical protein